MQYLKPRYFYYTLAALAVIGLAALYAVSPMQSDDFWYLMTAATTWSPLEAMMRAWQESLRHWTFDTGRLANLVSAPFLTLVPKWAFALICGAAVALVIHYSRWLVDASVRSMRSFFLIAGIVFALPWLDFMFSVVFAINYLWTTALVLMAISWIFKAGSRRRVSAGSVIAGACLCLIAGWMHEGFSVPVVCGLVAYYIVERQLPKGRALIYICAFLAGLLFIAVSPAVWNRVGEGVYGLGRLAGWEAELSFLAFDSLFFVFLPLAVVSYFRHLSPAQSARLTFLLTATTVATLMFVLFYTGPRMGWFCQLFSGIGILYCCSFYRFKLSAGWKLLWMSLIIIGVGGHLGYAVRWQLRLTDEFYRIVSLYNDSPDGTVYYDVYRPRIDASLLKPSFRQFNEQTPIGQFSYYYGPHKPDLILLPSDLAGFSADKATAAASDRSLMTYRGHIIAADSIGSDRRIDVRLDAGEWQPSRMRSVVFKGADGRIYSLLIPHLTTFSPKATVTDARLKK